MNSVTLRWNETESVIVYIIREEEERGNNPVTSKLKTWSVEGIDLIMQVLDSGWNRYCLMPGELLFIQLSKEGDKLEINQ